MRNDCFGRRRRQRRKFPISNVPGTVLDYQSLDYDSGYSAPRVFISAPEILVLSNGTCLAAHALDGRGSDSDASGKITVFRFTDREGTWTELTMINGVLRGSLVEYDGVVVFSNSVCNFNGAVQLAVPDNFDPAVGDAFRFMEGNTPNCIVLPALEDGRSWDTSLLLSSGDIKVVLKVPDAWMTLYALAEDCSEDFIDSDGDGMNNYAEWEAGIDPTDAESVFVLSASGVSLAGSVLRLDSLTGRTYRIEGGVNLLGNPVFQTLQSGIHGEENTTEYLDINSMHSMSWFCRIVIE